MLYRRESPNKCNHFLIMLLDLSMAHLVHKLLAGPILRGKRKFGIQLLIYWLKQFLILQQYRYRRMFEEYLESSSHFNYNMENISTLSRRISHFEIQKTLEGSQDTLEDSFKEDSAKNILISIDEVQTKQALRLRDQKNFLNGWVDKKDEKQRLQKSFRTKIYSKNKPAITHQPHSHRNSIENFGGSIPKLKDILKKLESPQKKAGYDNCKENMVFSQKKSMDSVQNNLTPPIKLQTAFHSINSRKTSRQKRRRIITFSDYKQTNRKPQIFDISEQQLNKMASVLVIKEACKQKGLRR